MDNENTSPRNQVNEKKQKLSNNLNKVMKRLRHMAGMAIKDFNMIEDGDKVMVCMSGGKDSYVLLEVLQSLQRSAPIDFTLIPVHLNGNFPLYPEGLIEDYLKNTGLEYHIIKEDIYSLLKKTLGESSVCSMCSRLRRGIIYKVAKELGVNKIALGHHADDILETFFLNLFYGGKLKAMPPKLFTDDEKNIVIRPLAYCREADILKYSRAKNYPIFPKEMCALVQNKERSNIKDMIKMWDREYPGRSQIIFKALKDISLSHLLDTTKYDFTFSSKDLIKDILDKKD